MIRIVSQKDFPAMLRLPEALQGYIKDIVRRLDQAYGANRTINDGMGGYVLVVETEDDLIGLSDLFGKKVDAVIPEYTEMLRVGKEKYTDSLIVCNNDFSISIIMPYNLTPKHFLADMGEGDRQ